MSLKQDQNQFGKDADQKVTEAKATPKSRRDLLSAFLPAAAAVAAVACSGAKLKGANGANNSNNDKSNSPAGPGTTGTPPTGGNPNDPSTTVPTDTMVLPSIPKVKDTDVAITFDSKIYGSAQSAMLVAAIPNLHVGDQIVIGYPLGDNVQVISRRTVQIHDLSNPVVIDNINLYGQPQLDVYIYSADCARKHGVVKTSEDDLKLARTFMGKAVVDARSISLPVSGYDGAHPNFFTLMPMLNWGEPSSIVNFHGQKNSVAGVNRPFKVAKADAMWTIPGDLEQANVTICDAMGVVIANAKPAAGVHTTGFIAQHSMFIVYLLDTADNNHYHRYFYFVG